MRIVAAVSGVFVLTLVLAISAHTRPTQAAEDGQSIFRFDTFGDEQLWTDTLLMHQALQNVTPRTALGVGLKIDVEALPAEVKSALQNGQVNLDDPAVTALLLRLNAVVGVKAAVTDAGQITRAGITCALCHSTVDDSFAPSIGKRLDGWAATDLDVGTIVALSPALDDATKTVFRSWGAGMYDPRHHWFDGQQINVFDHDGDPSTTDPSVPVVIPPIYGLKGVEFETYTGDGPISYWNSYVGVGQMGGKGNFRDDRIGLIIQQSPDLVTPKLVALLNYQLSLKTPKPPAGSYNRDAAERGKDLFRGQAGCASCHKVPNLTDVVSDGSRSTPFLHDPAEVGMDARYAERSATKQYRTTPLRGLFQHAPYFHDGSAPNLLAVVNHYDRLFHLRLTAAQKADLVEYLKSL